VITSGNTMNVTTNLNRSLIQWNTFSIGQGGTVNFNQPSSVSAVLNRVMGGVPSEILGAMNSNGRVYLINPNGITFGAGAQIDVAGLVASTLNLSNSDFLANRLVFTDGAGAGSVVNRSNINSGEVYLVGKSVTNEGLIKTPKGEVVLAAGNSVELVNPGTPNLRVEIAATDHQAVNLGQIVADAGRVGIYAGLVRQGGTIRADSAQLTDDGRIVLKATKDVTLDAGSITSASGPKGGTIDIQSGDRALVFGDVSATGSAGKGGTVQVLGNLVGVMGNATIDASGDTGGGTVLVGGDFQGKNPAIQNAYRTVLGPDATIKADAGTNGDGGKVIVWSDDGTRAYGTISARGGNQGGDGGFVEVSGKRWLDFHARVDTRAPNGKTGTLLLDPNDVQILAGTCCGGEGGFTSTGDAFVWTNSGSGTSTVLWGDAEAPGTIVNNLQSNNVIITTAGPGGQAGDINVIDSVSYFSNNSLSLIADRDITVQGAVGIVNGGNGDINLIAGRNIGVGVPASACLSCFSIGDARIETGGNILLSALNDISIVGSTLRAGHSETGRSSSVLVGAGRDLMVLDSIVEARGSDAFGFTTGFNGIVSLTAGRDISIQDSEITAQGGSASVQGGLGQVSISAGGNVVIDQPQSQSTFIQARGGSSFGGEGASGGAGIVLVAANGSLSLNGGAQIEAEGGNSDSGAGGPGQVALFGGSVSIVTDSCCGDVIYARGGFGNTVGGAGSVAIFGGSILIDGAEGGIRAFGGGGFLRGGDGVITIGDASTGSVTLRRNSVLHAAGGFAEGAGGTGGNSSIGITAQGDIFSLDSHIEAEGGFGSTGGSAVVAMTSLQRGIVIDGSGSSFDTTIIAEGGFGSSLGGSSEVALRAFDIISVNQDRVEAFAGEGGTAQIKLHFTGRTTGGWFVNGLEAPNPPVAAAPVLPPASVSADHGFFINDQPAEVGVNFFVTYSGRLPEPCLVAPEICQPPRVFPPEITDATSSPGTDQKGSKDKKEQTCTG
jgi:filamentous hemagglutinin family protein